jgi:predicted regulator of Ras-like GTPase activity (Roadblock/LC7/MglB family)
MTDLNNILQKMATEMDGIIAMGIAGMDGIGIAHHNPSGAPVEALDAKFAMIMKLIERTISDIPNSGTFEENLVQTENIWFFTKFLTHQHYLGIAVSRSATLGHVRLIANRYTSELQTAIAAMK